MSKSWYSRINELELKDGSTKIEHHLVFETDSKEIKKKVESFFKSIMDGKDDPGWCEWTLIDAEFNVYDTACRNPWLPEEGTPEDNKMIYCPTCGRKIKVVKAKN